MRNWKCFVTILGIVMGGWQLHAGAQGKPNVVAKFDSAGQPTSNSILFDNGSNVGIATTNPTERLTLGSGNLMLPTANGGEDGSLYFGGTTDTGEIGLRLFGGKFGGPTNDWYQSGFIDVRAGRPTDGLIIRVDNLFGGIERMRITANGNTGIGTANPTQKLDVAGTIRSSAGGFMFPDGTVQSTATLHGPQGPQGPAGPPGPPTHTVAVCQQGAPVSCDCQGQTVSRVFGACTVTSDTGSCGHQGAGCCAVCAP
jgi:hypothetical protein